MNIDEIRDIVGRYEEAKDYVDKVAKLYSKSVGGSITRHHDIMDFDLWDKTACVSYEIYGSYGYHDTDSIVVPNEAFGGLDALEQAAQLHKDKMEQAKSLLAQNAEASAKAERFAQYQELCREFGVS